jgi:hypothetical protein
MGVLVLRSSFFVLLSEAHAAKLSHHISHHISHYMNKHMNKNWHTQSRASQSGSRHFLAPLTAWRRAQHVLPDRKRRP